MDIAFRLACIAIGLPFVWLGYEAVTAPGARVAMAAKLRIPHPEIAVRFNGVAMVAGGIGVATGVLWQAAAVGLVISLIPTTLAGHAFWAETDPQARKANRIQFLKNLGLMGGLLAVALAPYVNG
ncbi:DoxX family protein [Nonomuraea turcica]|uniref:DoxX family protein n=1 Tax=Nonomuraea sp. G32 TaxID=3067274 RepID=UPI00273C9BE6|nr:DoxX family protein [Nonomuraea sp. G32]MDP4504159.1 DoxX family protein [Nonomuraea sp. G32]